MKHILIAAFLILTGASPAFAQSAPTVTPAMDGIFEAFKTHPLVGIGEHHRIAQELDFYNALMRDPRFTSEVGNVVVEFGGAIHQDIIDRYVDGQDVPYTELRKVWTDTVGWLPVVSAIGYPNFSPRYARPISPCRGRNASMSGSASRSSTGRSSRAMPTGWR